MCIRDRAYLGYGGYLNGLDAAAWAESIGGQGEAQAALAQGRAFVSTLATWGLWLILPLGYFSLLAQGVLVHPPLPARPQETATGPSRICQRRPRLDLPPACREPAGGGQGRDRQLHSDYRLQRNVRGRPVDGGAKTEPGRRAGVAKAQKGGKTLKGARPIGGQ